MPAGFWGASIDGKTLFTGSSGPGGRLGWRGSLMPGDSGAIRRERGERGEVVAAFPRDRQRGGIQDGRLAATAAEERAGMAVGADRRETGPDVAGGGGRAGGARHAGERPGTSRNGPAAACAARAAPGWWRKFRTGAGVH